MAEVFRYRAHVDAAMAELLRREADVAGPVSARVVLGLHHEQQHQELILTDLKHALALNPLRPAYAQAAAPVAGQATPLEWTGLSAGLRTGDR